MVIDADSFSGDAASIVAGAAMADVLVAVMEGEVTGLCLPGEVAAAVEALLRTAVVLYLESGNGNEVLSLQQLALMENLLPDDEEPQYEVQTLPESQLLASGGRFPVRRNSSTSSAWRTTPEPQPGGTALHDDPSMREAQQEAQQEAQRWKDLHDRIVADLTALEKAAEAWQRLGRVLTDTRDNLGTLVPTRTETEPPYDRSRPRLPHENPVADGAGLEELTYGLEKMITHAFVNAGVLGHEAERLTAFRDEVAVRIAEARRGDGPANACGEDEVWRVVLEGGTVVEVEADSEESAVEKVYASGVYDWIGHFGAVRVRDLG